MEFIDAAMKWVVAPIAVFVLQQYRIQQTHATAIAVLQAQAAATKEAHDREFKQLQDNFKTVLAKLDGIELALRK